MSGNDLIRGRDVCEILLDEGWYEDTMQRVDALPPAVLAELPEVRALVAAALQRAADEIKCGCGFLKGCEDPHACPQEDVAAILALIDTDHAAALEAVKAQVREEAAKIADQYEAKMRNDAELWRKDKMPHTGLLSDAMANGVRRVAAAIRAGKVQP